MGAGTGELIREALERGCRNFMEKTLFPKVRYRKEKAKNYTASLKPTAN